MTNSLWLFVVVRASTILGGSCAGSPNLTNTNPVSECLLAATRCFVDRRDCCSLLDRCAAERMRFVGRATRRPPAPKSDRFGEAQRCFANLGELTGMGRLYRRVWALILNTKV